MELIGKGLIQYQIKSSTCDNTPYHCRALDDYFNIASGTVRHNANYAYLYYGILNEVESKNYFSIANADQFPNTDSGLSKKGKGRSNFVFINDPHPEDINVQ